MATRSTCLTRRQALGGLSFGALGLGLPELFRLRAEAAERRPARAKSCIYIFLNGGASAGKPINDGTRMAHTTLMALMGRMAAYTGQEITWDQALNSQESLNPGKMEWDVKLNLPPRAVPGLTRFS